MEKHRSFNVLSEEVKYKNHWLMVSELATETDGQLGLYSVINRNNCVSIIIENHNKMILLVKQYRFPTRDYAWELPMGGIENGESECIAANREANEEVGININLQKINFFYPMPGLTKQKAYVYYGKIGEVETLKVKQYNEDIDEIVERRFFDFKEIQEMIKQREIVDGLTLSSLAILECWTKEI